MIDLLFRRRSITATTNRRTADVEDMIALLRLSYHRAIR
jgi:hypothetical protein